MVYSGQEWCLFIKIVSTFVGNNWVPGRCGNGGNGVIKLGFFKYNEGMEDCLNSCRIFGLTACEFDKDDGECWAYSNDVAIGKGKPVTFCYKFKGITFKHASWPYFLMSYMSQTKSCLDVRKCLCCPLKQSLITYIFYKVIESKLKKFVFLLSSETPQT
jgi:hypothetical protein